MDKKIKILKSRLATITMNTMIQIISHEYKEKQFTKAVTLFEGCFRDFLGKLSFGEDISCYELDYAVILYEQEKDNILTIGVCVNHKLKLDELLSLSQSNAFILTAADYKGEG